MTGFVKLDLPLDQAVPLILHAMSDLLSDQLSSGLVSLAQIANVIWIRVECDDEMIDQRMGWLPGIVYRSQDNHLYRDGNQVPSSMIPGNANTVWQPLREVCQIEVAQPQVSPGKNLIQRQRVALIRGGVVCEPSALMTSIDELLAWVDTAPQNRINGLSWMFQRTIQRCLVVGAGLPPVSGSYFVKKEGILFPAGMIWSPRVSPSTLRQIFEVGTNEWLLWEADGSYVVLQEQELAVMSRANVRVAAQMLGKSTSSEMNST